MKHYLVRLVENKTDMTSSFDLLNGTIFEKGTMEDCFNPEEELDYMIKRIMAFTNANVKNGTLVFRIDDCEQSKSLRVRVNVCMGRITACTFTPWISNF